MTRENTSVASFFIFLLLSAHPLEAMRKYKLERGLSEAASDLNATDQSESDGAVMQELENALQDLSSGRVHENVESHGAGRCERKEHRFDRMTQELFETMKDYKNGIGLGFKAMDRRTSASIMLKAFRITRNYEEALKNKCEWVNEVSAERGETMNEVIRLNKEVNPCTQKAVDTLKKGNGSSEEMARAFSLMVEGIQGEACVGALEEQEINDDDAALVPSSQEESGDLDDETVQSLENIANGTSLIAVSQSLSSVSRTSLASSFVGGATPSLATIGYVGFQAVVFLYLVMNCVTTVSVAYLILNLIWCLIRTAINTIVKFFSVTKSPTRYPTRRPTKAPTESSEDFVDADSEEPSSLIALATDATRTGIARFSWKGCLRRIWRRAAFETNPMDKQLFFGICVEKVMEGWNDWYVGDPLVK